MALAAGDSVVKRFTAEWPAFGVVEVDRRLVEDAAGFATAGDLRSLDALHLASALLLSRAGLTVATWDRRLHQALAAHEIALLPEQLPESTRSLTSINGPHHPIRAGCSRHRDGHRTASRPAAGMAVRQRRGRLGGTGAASLHKSRSARDPIAAPADD